MRSEFASRFPGKAVRHIIYSHSHWDHAGGAGEAWYAPPGEGNANAYGYPVHVMFSVNAAKDIDALYWLIWDGAGH